MRVAYGRKAVEPGLMEELPNNKFKLEDFFDVEVVDMVQKKIFQKVLRYVKRLIKLIK